MLRFPRRCVGEMLSDLIWRYKFPELLRNSFETFDINAPRYRFQRELTGSKYRM